MAANRTLRPTLAAVVGSLRADSYNRAVFRAAQGVFAGVTLVEAPIVDLVLYDGDVEEAGDPPGVQAFKETLGAADGLVFFTPEYNRSIPAVTKNALDWSSRRFGEGPIVGKPVGIVAAGPGRHDLSGVREHLAASVAAAGGVVHQPTLAVGSIRHLCTEGELTDPEARERLAAWAEGFVAFVHAEAG